MNKFLQGFLNIPNGRIVDIFKLDYTMMPDEYNSNNIIELVKKVYDIDINLIVSNTINKYSEVFGSDNHNLAEYFEDIIYQLDEKTGIQKNYNSKHGKIEYLLCNIYQIIMCVNYDNYYNLNELKNRFSSIVGKNISATTVRRSIKTYYEKNVISYLFLPDNVMRGLSNKSVAEIQETLKNNYVCSEAWEEVIVPAVLHGSKNIYTCDKDRSAKNLKWFYNNYYGTLEKVYQSHLKESSGSEIRSEISKAQIVKELGETSLHCNKYISEMIFSLNYYFDLTSLLYGKTDDSLVDILFDDFACTILIPDIKRRKFYSELIMDMYNVLGCFEYVKMSRIISDKIKYESTVYYPILMLAAIECVRKLARQKKEDKNATRFFIGKLKESFGAISENVSKFDKAEKFNTNSKEAWEAIHYYFYVSNEYYNRDNYSKFTAKITTYDFDYGELVKCYMKHGINVFDKYDDEYDFEEDGEDDSTEDCEDDPAKTEE